jgi:hypothetical protein
VPAVYVEAICPLCLACHVVSEDLRGEKYRCEECEEEFIISRKAKRTNKKPARLREVQAADEPAAEVTPIEEAEVLPEAKLVQNAPTKKKPKPDDDEVLEIPDDAVQSGAPRVKAAPAATPRSRDRDEEDDRPRKRPRDEEDDGDDRPRRRPVRRSGPSAGLIVALSAGLVLLLGLGGVATWVALSEKSDDKPQAQAPANHPQAAKKDETKAPLKKEDPPRRVDPPKPAPPPVEPPKADPPKVEPPKADPPKIEAPAEWTVKADPPPAAVKLPADYRKDIPVPGRAGQLIFPRASSPFVAIGINLFDGDERQVWNLQTGDKIGAVKGAIRSSQNPVLSPDGAHLAFLPTDKPGTVDVWVLGPGKLVNIDIGGPLSPFDLLDFAGPGKLLTGRRSNDRTIFRVYDVASGKQEREFDAIRLVGYVGEAAAVSPGGTYLALADRDNLWVYDLKTGAAAGQCSLPKWAGLRPATCSGLSFSSDGSELAAVFFPPGQGHVTCWDVAKGNVVCDLSFAQARPHPATLNVYRGHVIDWLGERRGWLLYGYTLVERNKPNSTTFLPTPPAVGSPIPRHLVGTEHVVTLATGGKPGESVLTVNKFDADKPK